MMEKIAPYGKALTGALVAGLSVLLAAAGDLNGEDYLAALIAFLVAGGAVWAVPNSPAPPEHPVPGS